MVHFSSFQNIIDEVKIKYFEKNKCIVKKRKWMKRRKKRLAQTKK